MMRRYISAMVVVACAGAYAFAAERATFILTDGERKSGELVFHGGNAANFIDGDLNLGNSGKEEPIHVDQVAVIDIVGGTPSPAELSKVPATGQAVATRDGNVATGKFVNITHGDTLLWESTTGQQTQYALRDVARIYLNPASARTAFNYNGPSGATAVGTSGTNAQSRTITVDARQAWTDTGVTVNTGDQVAFQASGEILFGRSPGQSATPDGNTAGRSAKYPDPTVPVGALVGRIGTNGKPFAIGMQTQPLPMPASGRLYLGVNDNELGDNSGAFTVIVTKQ